MGRSRDSEPLLFRLRKFPHSFLSLFFILLPLFLLSFPLETSGEPLTKALVRKTINRVFYYPTLKKSTEPDQAVAGKTVVQGNDALKTGQNSRSELLFNDKSIARVGSNAVFSFDQGTRNLNLADGTMLMQVPKNSKNTTIRTAAATAAVTGTTVMMEHKPKSHVKMITLEGTMNVSINDRPGESRTLKGGQMLLFPPDAERLPEPVTVDVQHIKETSQLINGFDQEEDQEGETESATTAEGEKKQQEEETAESQSESRADGETPDPDLKQSDEEVNLKLDEVNRVIEQQNQQMKEGTLQSTNLVIKGEGTEVDLESSQEEQNVAQEVTQEITSSVEQQDNQDAIKDSTEIQSADPDVIQAQQALDQVASDLNLDISGFQSDITQGSQNVSSISSSEDVFVGTVDGNLDLNLSANDVPSSSNLLLLAGGDGSSLNLQLSLASDETLQERSGSFTAISQGPLNVLPGSSFGISGNPVQLRSQGKLTVIGAEDDPSDVGYIRSGSGLTLLSQKSTPGEVGISIDGQTFTTQENGNSLTRKNVRLESVPRQSGVTGNLFLTTGGSDIEVSNSLLSVRSPFDGSTNSGTLGTLFLNAGAGSLTVTNSDLVSGKFSSEGSFPLSGVPGSGGAISLTTTGGDLTFTGSRAISPGGAVSMSSGGALTLKPGSPYRVMGGSVNLSATNRLRLVGPQSDGTLAPVLARGGDLTLESASTDAGVTGIAVQSEMISADLDGDGSSSSSVSSLPLMTLPGPNGSVGTLSLTTQGSGIQVENTTLGYFPSELGVEGLPDSLVPSSLPDPTTRGGVSLNTNGGPVSLKTMGVITPGGPIELRAGSGSMTLNNVGVESLVLNGPDVSTAGDLTVSGGSMTVNNTLLSSGVLKTADITGVTRSEVLKSGSGGDIALSTNSGDLTVTGSALFTPGGAVTISAGSKLTLQPGTPYTVSGGSVEFTAGGQLALIGPETDGTFGTVFTQGGELSFHSNRTSSSQTGIRLAGSLVQDPLTETTVPSLRVEAFMPPEGTPGNISLSTDGSKIVLQNVTLRTADNVELPSAPQDRASIKGGNISIDAGGGAVEFTDEVNVVSPVGALDIAGKNVVLGTSTDDDIHLSPLTEVEISTSGDLDMLDIDVSPTGSELLDYDVDVGGQLTMVESDLDTDKGAYNFSVAGDFTMNNSEFLDGGFDASNVGFQPATILDVGGNFTMNNNSEIDVERNIALDVAGNFRLDGADEIESDDGNIDINSSGNFTVRDDSDIDAELDLSLAVGGDFLVKGSGSDLDSDEGDITLDVAGSITDVDDADIDSDDGSLEITAGGSATFSDHADIDSEFNLRIVTGSNMSLLEDSDIDADDGSVFLDVGGDLDVSGSATDIDAERNITLEVDGDASFLGSDDVDADDGDVKIIAAGDFTSTGDPDFDSEVDLTLDISGDLTVKDESEFDSHEGSIRLKTHGGKIELNDPTTGDDPLEIESDADEVNAELVGASQSRVEFLTAGGDLLVNGSGSSSSNRVHLESCQSNCDVTDSTFSDHHGGIVMNTVDPSDATLGGRIEISNTTLGAEVISARGLGSGSEKITIGQNTTFKSTERTRIYTPVAPDQSTRPSGEIHFEGNVRFQGGSPVEIVAPNLTFENDSIEIDNTDAGSLTIYTNNSDLDLDDDGDDDDGQFTDGLTIKAIPEPNTLSTITDDDPPFVITTGSPSTDAAKFDLDQDLTQTSPSSPNLVGVEGATLDDGEPAYFQGQHLDGPATEFYFGNTNSSGFDAVVGLNDPVDGLERFADWTAVGSFKFNDVDIGDINLTTGSNRHLAVIGESSLDLNPSFGNDGNAPAVQPKSVFLATEAGPITVNANPGPDFDYDLTQQNNWMFYARGDGSDLTFQKSFSVIDPGSTPSKENGGELRAYAENNLAVDPNAKLEARHVSARAGDQIKVSNSSQLRALVESGAQGGRVTVRTQEGPVVLEATTSEDRITLESCESSCSPSNLSGEVLVESGLADGASGQISTQHARIRADTLKMRAYGPSGELIIGNGTTLSASDLMRLYATGSSGKVLFRDNVTLQGGGSLDIAAKTVEITNNATVDNNISTDVYADNHNYGSNNSNYGQFSDPPNDKDNPLSERPGYHDD